MAPGAFEKLRMDLAEVEPNVKYSDRCCNCERSNAEQFRARGGRRYAVRTACWEPLEAKMIMALLVNRFGRIIVKLVHYYT